MESLRIQDRSDARGALVIIALFGLVVSIAAMFGGRITWQTCAMIVVLTLGIAYLGSNHSFEFGDDLKHRNFTGVHTYDWREVESSPFLVETLCGS